MKGNQAQKAKTKEMKPQKAKIQKAKKKGNEASKGQNQKK